MQNISRNSETIFINLVDLLRNLYTEFIHPLSLKLLTRLRLGMSHFNDHRSNHTFETCINLLYIYSFKNE